MKEEHWVESQAPAVTPCMAWASVSPWSEGDLQQGFLVVVTGGEAPLSLTCVLTCVSARLSLFRERSTGGGGTLGTTVQEGGATVMETPARPGRAPGA